MNDELLPFADDPYGYRDDLRDALTDPDLKALGPDGERAAYRVALALGRCRLFGVAPGDDLNGVMPAPMATAAASDLTRLLLAWAAKAGRLGELWDATDDPAEADNLCAGLLGARMSAWAVGFALDEAYADCLEGDPARSALAAAIDRMQNALDPFDEELERHSDVLATVTGTRLLDGWRAFLAPAFREDLPWWLDGRLEEAAEQLKAEAAATLPGKSFWAVLHERLVQLLGRVPVLPPMGAWNFAHADVPGTTAVVPGQTLCWMSPLEEWRLELELPKTFSPEEENRLRPLNFTRLSDDQPALELAGRRFRLGSVLLNIDDKGQAWVRLADLREAGKLRLRVYAENAVSPQSPAAGPGENWPLDQPEVSAPVEVWRYVA